MNAVITLLAVAFAYLAGVATVLIVGADSIEQALGGFLGTIGA